MGCGSSKTEGSRLRHAYGEPSEFDTCSSVVSAARDTRGEPDGGEIFSSSAPPELPTDHSHRVSSSAPKERLGSLPSRRTHSVSRGTVNSSKTKADSHHYAPQTTTTFNELSEHAGQEVGVHGASTSQLTASVTGDNGDFLTAS